MEPVIEVETALIAQTQGLKAMEGPEEYVSPCLPWEYDPVLKGFPDNTHSHGPNSQLLHGPDLKTGQNSVGGDKNDDGVCVKDQNKSLSKSPSVLHNFVPNCKNLDTTDQSKCSMAPERITLGFGNHVSKQTSPENKIKTNDTGNCFKFPAVPDSLGPVESIPCYLAEAKNDEETAWDLQGLIFTDEDLGWCMVTGWGVDHGVNIVFYTPCDSKDPDADEEHASLAEVLSWIQESPDPPRISDYRSSRTIKKSNDVKSLMMRHIFPIRRSRPVIGTMLAPRSTMPVPNVKILPSKTIIRILKTQETFFKYGTFIPRNDREAELSPEAIR
jgi:hypothetical protein